MRAERAPAFDPAAIAREVKEAQDRVAKLAPYPGLDMASGYAVARRVDEQRRAEGWVRFGRKVGFTNSSLWPVYGVREPIWGTMYDRTVTRLAGAKGRLSVRAFAEPRIEPEIAFGLRSAPGPGSDPAMLLGSIEWVAHGFEIVQSHYPGWKFRAADTVADNGLHGALLLGEPRDVSRLGADPVEALRSFSVELSCDGAAKETGRGANVLGSPLAALAHLVSVLAAYPGSEPLHAGEIVTTGTLTAAYPVRPGEVWTTRLRGIDLPGLELSFVA
ncbi:MAG TPA: fumarylacetoacetate hydrolase family protein [Myxococcota bacterium]|nr:fumarylacetoacetate hydrolase family protein [Myxococcota bacterium]